MDTNTDHITPASACACGVIIIIMMIIKYNNNRDSNHYESMSLFCCRMSQPGVTGVLCADNQGLALIGKGHQFHHCNCNKLWRLGNSISRK